MSTVEDLLSVMRRLRDPQEGCPWIINQDFASIAVFTVEEAYEVADAIEREAWEELRGELGDLLLQVVYHAEMASARGLFEFEDVVEAICTKMVERHPHVFADAGPCSEEEIKAFWEEIKHRERTAAGYVGVLSDVPRTLPALTRAYKLQHRAACVGFDWSEAQQVEAKIDEEIEEMRNAPDEQARADEIGDVLFTLVNYARHCGERPEELLQRACSRFQRRFHGMEARLAETGEDVESVSAERWEALWTEVKRAEAG